MQKPRLEAFSDGVLAIVITILILEFKVPHEGSAESLFHLWPLYLSYLVSFFTIFMMWLNHHNIFSTLETINVRINWANGFFLLSVSHIPFVTGLAGEARWASPLPVALYGVVMVFVSISIVWLRHSATMLNRSTHSSNSNRRESKTGIGIIIAYTVAVPLSWLSPVASLGIYILVPVARLLSSQSYRDNANA